MKNKSIAADLLKNLATIPAEITAEMVGYCYEVNVRTAQRALESLAAMGVMKQNGKIFCK